MSQPLNFSYKARNRGNDVIRGSMEAASESQVVSKLKSQGLIPIWVRQEKRSILTAEIGGGKKVRLDEIALASRQLAVLFGNGVPLLRSLEVVSAQTDNPRLKKAFEQIKNAVETGSSLSAALSQHSEIFPPIMVNLVRVGESGGFIDQSLEAIADELEAELKLRDKVKAAMTYPIIVLGIAILGAVLIVAFVVPQFESMYQSLGGELPLPTAILLGLSRTAVFWLPILIGLIVLVYFWYRSSRNNPSVRKTVDTFKLNMPIFGNLNRKVAIARFSRSMALLLRSGVPLLQAITLVKQTSGNWVFEQALERVEDSVSKGQSFSAPLLEDPTFPPMLSRMAAVGEDSGSLDQMLENIARFYDREVNTATDQLSALVEPLLVVIVGVLIGGMVVSLYLPMFSIFELVG